MMANHRAPLFAEPLAAKVPEITVIFWVIKILTTAGGEAASDYLALHNKVVGGAIEIAVLCVALFLQFRVRRYSAPQYWFLAYAIATAGTGIADTMHLTIGLPYSVTTAFWAIVLAVVFWYWQRSEGTLSIHSIVTRRRELDYWATVFATFALGTALGDFTATALHLGYLGSGILFAVLITLPWIAWRVSGPTTSRPFGRRTCSPVPWGPPSPTTSARPGTSVVSITATARRRSCWPSSWSCS
jgi:uncharacterized membrane-anchored protein